MFLDLERFKGEIAMRKFLFVHIFICMVWISNGLAVLTEDDSRASALIQPAVSAQIHQELARSSSPSTSQKHIELQGVAKTGSHTNDSDHKPGSSLNYFMAMNPNLTKSRLSPGSTDISLLSVNETNNGAKTLPHSHSAVDLPCSSKNQLDNASPPHSEAEASEETSLCTHHSDPKTPDKDDVLVNKTCLKPKYRWCLVGAIVPSIAFLTCVMFHIMTNDDCTTPTDPTLAKNGSYNYYSHNYHKDAICSVPFFRNLCTKPG